MDDNKIKVLLIEDNPGDARLIQEMFVTSGAGKYDLQWAQKLSKGIELLGKGDIDVVLLDLVLPDSLGFGTFTKLRQEFPEIPILVLTGIDDESLAIQAVHSGAQDYLVKGQINAPLLVRAVRYAIERQRIEETLKGLSFIDELTGLYNRRGFLTLTDQQLKIARRNKKDTTILFLDLDKLKSINDNFGHSTGDKALAALAVILRATFRESDLIARIGGDEFVILAIETFADTAAILVDRLQKNLDSYNQENIECGYKLNLSIGLLHYKPDDKRGVEELLSQADELMYQQKRKKNGPQAA